MTIAWCINGCHYHYIRRLNRQVGATNSLNMLWQVKIGKIWENHVL